MIFKTLAVLATVLALTTLTVSCGGGQQRERAQNVQNRARARRITAPNAEHAESETRCNSSAANREASEYDTSGDNVPDVRKVFLQVGTPPLIRLILICREADLNADGRKDVVRYYNDEGRPMREESDRDFDGAIDEISFFENGRIARVEEDANKDGKIDSRTFYERGRPVRAERDLAGRSTDSDNGWRPDRWEYYEDGRLVRMGTDLDQDGVVDRWDRLRSSARVDQTVEDETDGGVADGGAQAASAPMAPSR